MLLRHKISAFYDTSSAGNKKGAADYIPAAWIIIGDTIINAAMRPDLVDLETKEIWEIKPVWLAAEGRAQLQEYLSMLDMLSEVGDKRWSEGSSATYRPPPSVGGLLINNEVTDAGRGLILYSPFTKENAQAFASAAATFAIFQLWAKDQEVEAARRNSGIGTAVMLGAY